MTRRGVTFAHTPSRRTAMARLCLVGGLGLALAANPRLLLLDEPAGGLNQDEGQELAELIGKVRELGITVWVIEHDMPFIMSLCERIIVLHVGKRIAEGRPTEVANDPNVISVFLGEKFAKDSAT